MVIPRHFLRLLCLLVCVAWYLPAQGQELEKVSLQLPMLVVHPVGEILKEVGRAVENYDFDEALKLMDTVSMD